jgi:hypothetical protein
VARVVVCVMAVAALVPAVARAWTPTTPQISVSVFGGSNSNDYGYSVAVDGSGNIYTAGAFQVTADFDPGAGTTNFTSAGANDVFVSKLDSSGNLVWAKTFGGTANDIGFSVAVDGSGNVYTTGYFFGTVDFDPGAGTTNLTSAGSDDVFVSKLDSSGNLVWAKTFGGTSADNVQSMAVDGSGNVYTTGVFNNTADFDPGAGTTNLTSAGSGDVFVSKLDSSGNLVWAKTFGGTSNDYGRSVAVDGSGNIYTTGNFYGTVDFDPGAGTTNLGGGGASDVFVSKLDSSGNLVWAKTFGGTSSDIGYSVAVDGSGNVHTTGYFEGTADFDPGAGTTNRTSAGNQDVFVSELDSSGNLVWAKTFGGATGDIGYSVAVDGSGSVHTTGYFYGTVDFDPGAGTTNRTSAGSHDVFVSKLDSSGNLVWAKTFGGATGDIGYSVAVDGSGSVHTTGYFSGTVDFDPDAGTTNLSTSGFAQVFVSKLDSSGSASASTTTTTVASTTTTTVVATTTTTSTTTTAVPNLSQSATTTTMPVACPEEAPPPAVGRSSAVCPVVVPGPSTGTVTTTTVKSPGITTTTAVARAGGGSALQGTTTTAPTTTLPTLPVGPAPDVPDVGPGDTGATVGGRPVEPTVTHENGDLVVTVDDATVRYSLTGPNGQSQPIPVGGPLTLLPGTEVTVRVSGLRDEGTTEVWILPAGLRLGDATLDNGSGSVTGVIPEDAAATESRLVVTSEDETGDPVVVAYGVNVSDVPSTGNSWSTALIVIVALAILSALFLPAARRRGPGKRRLPGGVDEAMDYVGIYNADGTLLGEVSYVLAKYTGRGHCELCDITHGTFRRKRSWDTACDRAGINIVLLHRDETDAEQLAAAGDLPAVIRRDGDGWRLVAGPAALAACGGDPERLMSLLSGS